MASSKKSRAPKGKLVHGFNRQSLKKMGECGQVLGLKGGKATLNYALSLIEMAVSARQQGQELALATVQRDDRGNLLSAQLDAVVLPGAKAGEIYFDKFSGTPTPNPSPLKK